MKIPSSRQHGDYQDDVSLTPMIDVVFLLLIFFVCASVGQIPESILSTELAAGTVSAEQFEEVPKPLGEIWLYLKQRGDGVTVVQLNAGGTEFADFALFKVQLAQIAELGRDELPVILDIGPNVPLGDVIHIYDACRSAQFRSIHFAAEERE